MLKSLAVFATLATGALCLSAGIARAQDPVPSPSPSSASAPRIAVVGVDGVAALAELRLRVARAVADGLSAAGAEVVPAAASGVHRVRGTLEVEGRTYVLRLELLDAQSGTIVESREDRCEICTESEALETAGVAASALKAQVFKRRLAGASESAVASPPPAVPAVATVATPEVETTSASPPRHRGLGVAGIVAGAVAAGVGGWLLTFNHNYTCEAPDQMKQCPQRWNTLPGGLTLLGTGVLAVTGGVLAVAGVF